jgi:predicted amidohydrolase
MSNKFRVALLQMAAHGVDQAANLAKADRFCREAAAGGADIALFPEMWNIGYTSFTSEDSAECDIWKAPDLWASTPVDPKDPELLAARDEWWERAIDAESGYVRHFRDLARELDMAIAPTYLEKWPRAPRNSVSLIDRTGQILFTYAKVHTCVFGYPEAALTPGDAFHVATLETKAGPVRIGAMICYDREFPESARLLMLQGAEIVLVPNACGLGINRLTQFRARAFENLIGLAMANYAAPDLNGHSIAFDGIPFDDEGNDRDMLLVEAGSQEGVFLADFDLDALRRYRIRETWGNAFRRPSLYGGLVDTAINEPFIRTDIAGKRYDEHMRSY